MKLTLRSAILSCVTTVSLFAAAPVVPDWALPGSATHKQVPPPKDFHRETVTSNEAVGLFTGQSDIGAALVPGHTKFDSMHRRYTIDSAGYNIWYSRDEFRFLWKKMSGDVSLAADIVFPNPEGYGDRKVVLIIRQSLDDDAKEAMVALHGAGLIHLAQRTAKNAEIKEAYRIAAPVKIGATPPKSAAAPKRLGIEKHGKSFTLWVASEDHTLKQVGPVMELSFEEPFYVGVGFCSHLPDKSDTAVLANVVLENAAGKVH